MRMKKGTYMRVTAFIFFLIALGHALRLYFGWDAIVAGLEVPRWLSWGAVVAALYLAWQGFTHRR